MSLKGKHLSVSTRRLKCKTNWSQGLSIDISELSFVKTKANPSSIKYDLNWMLISL